MTSTPTRVAIYCRISKNNPKVPKVEDQEAMCRKKAAQELGSEGVDWVLVKVYVDDGISAFGFKDRPDWVELLTDAGAGAFDVLMAQSEDRFTRQPMEKETLVVACTAKKITWLTAAEGRTDPATADGAFQSTIRAAMGRMYVMTKTRAQKDANDALAARGEPLKGGVRPFGYDDDKRTLHSVEAPLVQQAYADFLAGTTLSAIRTRWNHEGVTSVNHKPWDIAKVEKLLRRPRNAGLVQHRGEVLPEVVGQWEPLVDEETFKAALALLDDPKRRSTRTHEPRWLCSSVARCGACGGPMRASARNGTENAYRCAVHEGVGHKQPGVRHTSIRAEDLDEMVTREVVRAIMYAPTNAVPDPDADRLAALHVELTEVRKRLQRWDDAYEADECTLAERGAKQGPLRKKAQAIEAEQVDIKSRNAQADMLSEARLALWSGTQASLTDAVEVKADIRARFDALDLERRRALVRGMVEVKVNPGRGNKRVKIHHTKATGLNDAWEPSPADEAMADAS